MGIAYRFVSAVLVFGFSLGVQLQARISDDPTEFAKWIGFQQQRSLKSMFNNISPKDGDPGAVIASPSKTNPNYYYHWVRDGSLVMSVVADFYKKTKYPESKAKSLQILNNFAGFSRKNQLTPNRSGPGTPDEIGGVGEPKFYVDGRAYDEDWGRPQSDGPALRALALIKFAKILLQQGRESYVREFLYDPQNHSNAVLSMDLDYVSRYWRVPSFDLWEEVAGTHFFTRMVQRKALLEGARFADDMKDSEGAKFYSGQAQAISTELQRHWSASTGKIYETISTVGGIQNKTSNLDSGVILGVLHGDTGDGFFGPTDDRVLSTAFKIKDVFRKIYPINQKEEIPGVGIGRYPEDTYDGSNDRVAGHPWFLTTLAFAELMYRAEADFASKGQIRITGYNQAFFQDLLPYEQIEVGATYNRDEEAFNRVLNALIAAGDSYILRVAYHWNRETSSMSEQFNRNSGYMLSAVDLTWSYASFLTATWARPGLAAQMEILKALGLQ